MITLLTKLSRLLKGLVIALGMLSLLAYLAAATISQYPQQIASSLSTLLGIPVEVNQAQANWHPLSPGLRLQGVTLGSGPDRVQVPTAVVGLDLTGLFKTPSPHLTQVTLVGVKLHLVREPGNNLHVLGLPLPHQSDEAPSRIRLPVRLRLADAEVIWEDRKHMRPPLRIAPVSFDIGGTDDQLRIAAIAHSPQGSIMIAAELAGDLSELSWSGRSRIVADRLNLAALLGDYLPEHYRLSDLELNGDVEIAWESAKPLNAQGRIDMANVRLAGDTAMHFEHLGANIAFARDPDEWRLELVGVRATRQQRTWPASTFTVQVTKTAPELTRVRAAADFLRLEDMVAILRVRSPWAELNTLFSKYALQGDIRDAHVDLTLGDKGVDWRAAANLHEFSSKAVEKVPGLTNFSGSLRAQSDHVQIELDGQNLTLDFGDLFRAPLHLDRAVGRVDWLRLSEAVWEVTSEDLRLSNSELTTRSRLRIESPFDQPLWVDLRTDFSSPDVSIAGHYYPTRIMRPSLVQWLDRGIVSGSIPRGSLSIFGPIKDFPFAKKHNGHFEVLFDIADMHLDYREEWPPMTDMAAEVRFHGLSLDIALHEAGIYDSRVEPTTGRFASLLPTTPLEIKGVVTGPLADELRLLRESPLRKRISGFTRAVRPSGNARVTLDLAIPMRRTGNYHLNGGLQFLGSGLDLEEWNLPLTNIRGELRFDLNSLRGKGLRARGLDSDLNLDVATIRDGTRISANGQLDVRTISNYAPSIPLQQVRGASHFKLGVTIPNSRQPADTPVRLDIQSDLRGIAIAAPQPLGKTHTEARVLDVRVPLTGRQRNIRVSYANQLDAIVAQDLSRGGIQLGPNPAELPARPGFVIKGELAAIDLDQWIEFTNSFALKQDQGTLPALDTAVKIGQIKFGDFDLTDVTLNFVHSGNELLGDISSELLKGRFKAPYPGYDPVNLDLDWLKFRFNDEPAQPAKSDTARNLDPRDWPSLKIRCEHLVVNEADLGKLEIDVAAAGNGLNIDKLDLVGDRVKANTKGTWRLINMGVTTQLAGTLTTPNLGRLLEQLGFTRQLDEAGAKSGFDLRWPGDPGEITQRDFTGHLDIELDQGRFLEIDPGAGRIVGLLNFHALLRRLRLDFSDLFKKGLSFDQITGKFTLDQGQAYTNDLTIDGPSGKIELAGRTGLTTRDVDHLVTVTPKLDATLPVASAIAGGPVAGIAVLVAQKLMSKKVDELNRFQYSIRGSWDDASVKLESSGSLAKLFRSQDQGPDEPASAESEDTTAGGENTPIDALGVADEQDLSQLPPTHAGKAGHQTRRDLNPIEKLFKSLGSDGTGLEALESVDR